MKKLIYLSLALSVMLVNYSFGQKYIAAVTGTTGYAGNLYHMYNVGVGTTGPTGLLHVIATGTKTASYSSVIFSNTTTSTTVTGAMIKAGLEIKSTGTWGGLGSKAPSNPYGVNIGLYVSSVSGGVKANYDAIFNGGGNVGIGTNAPTNKLDVIGSVGASENAFVQGYIFTNKLGVGIANPGQKLQVDGGNILVRGTNNFASTGNEAIMYFGDVNHYIKSVNGAGLKIGTYGAADAIFLQQGTGNVGIGTTTFTKGANTSYYKLAVKGNIHVYEVVVETGWSDFVFDKDYKLKSLSEVENFINEHKHLPDVPSAADVAENGISVGKTESILLQKIEELTLYMIDLKKENEQLKERISNLENK